MVPIKMHAPAYNATHTIIVHLLSLMGGIIGMLLSQGVLSAINYTHPDYHFTITKTVGAVALGFSFFVGVVFGIYPANKAANLKPINALRYE